MLAKAVSLLQLRGKWLAGYLGLLIAALLMFLLISEIGEGLPVPTLVLETSPGSSVKPNVDVLLHVVATLAAVVAVGYLLSGLFRYLGQPPVIGEVVAGILLGPSLLGAVAPDVMHLLVPSAQADPSGQVMGAINGISQLGAILYLFLVGLEFDAARLASKAHSAVAVSHASIVVPFVLGMLLALGLYTDFAPKGVPFTDFALFMGVAMSITAFPVLARILTDRRLEKTELGNMALSCAAADDVSAWCLLALIIGFTQASLETAVWVIGGTLLFIVAMFVVVRPLLGRLIRTWEHPDQELPPIAVVGTFLAVLLAALTSEAIGIHAVFGAFLLGAIIPHDSRIAREFSTKLKDTVTVLLLPAFFAATGLRTEIQLLNGWDIWFWCLAIILVATAGKFGGTLVAARLNRMSWRDSAALGTLMNTRGLMELIVLNIGLEAGVISPPLFAMMVVMALVTTAATSPALQWLIPGKTQPSGERPARAGSG